MSASPFKMFDVKAFALALHPGRERKDRSAFATWPHARTLVHVYSVHSSSASQMRYAGGVVA